MAIVFDATPGSASANSYLTVSEADEILASQFFTDEEIDPWNDVESKENALMMATRILDENINWIGWPASSLQALAWPRSSVYTRNGGLYSNLIVPDAVKRATAELARTMAVAKLGGTTSSTPAGLKALKAGPVSLEFDTSAPVVAEDVIPATVISMITFLIESRQAGRSTSIDLYRV
jgi:hypothetical protein